MNSLTIRTWFVGQIGQLYAVEKKLREKKAGPAAAGSDAELAIAVRSWNRLRRAMELTRRRLCPKDYWERLLTMRSSAGKC